MSTKAHPHPHSNSLEDWVEDAAFVGIFVVGAAIAAIILLLLIVL